MELLESALSNTLAFVFVLGVMVLIHELGHFWAARYFDVRVESFSFGFGPRLFGFRRGDTDYKVCALPLGGYVKMAGENVGEPTGDPREFLSKPRWQRLIIAFMGPLFNGILAVILLTGFYLFQYDRPVLSEPPVVAAAAEDSPAAKAGVQPGDVIRSIEGEPTPDWSAVTLSEVLAVNKTVSVEVLRDGSMVELRIPVEPREGGIGRVGWEAAYDVALSPTPESPAARAGIEDGDIVESIDGTLIRNASAMINAVQESGGRPMNLGIRRGDRRLNVQVEAEWDESAGSSQAAWRIGARVGPPIETTRLGPIDAFTASLKKNAESATLIFGALRGLIERRMSADSFAGPIGIAVESGASARRGAADLVHFMAAISLNLGIFNLLPIPILDGGVILMLLVESLIRRDLSLALKERVVQAGLVFLLLLFAFVMVNDILRYLPTG